MPFFQLLHTANEDFNFDPVVADFARCKDWENAAFLLLKIELHFPFPLSLSFPFPFRPFHFFLPFLFLFLSFFAFLKRRCFSTLPLE